MTCPKCGARLYREVDRAVDKDGFHDFQRMACWNGHTVGYAHALHTELAGRAPRAGSRRDSIHDGQQARPNGTSQRGTMSRRFLRERNPDMFPDDLSKVPD